MTPDQNIVWKNREPVLFAEAKKSSAPEIVKLIRGGEFNPNINRVFEIAKTFPQYADQVCVLKILG